MKRFLIVVLLAVLAAGLLAIPVSANAPPDAEFGVVELSQAQGILAVLIGILMIASPIGVTCFSEWFVASFFVLDKQERRLVLMTNLISQGLMWAVLLLCFFLGGVPFVQFYMEHYVAIVIVLEVLIYGGEFWVYCRKMRWYSWQRCLLLSVVANTTSLLLGMLCNIGLFMF